MEYESVLSNGHRVEEYEILQVLGAGGFGVTYLGQDHHLDKLVAIKEYLPNDLAVRKGDTNVVARSTGDQADFDWGLDRFLEEARVLAHFDHPNLPKVYRFFKANGTAYIVMDYIEGTPLDDIYAREGRLTEETLRGIIFPLLDGLDRVHEAGYLHRDVKPSNILIRSSGAPVLLDFGAARAALGNKSRSVTSIVTPGYAPLEQYSTRGDQGPWTDLYALGAVVYRGVTGVTPCDVTDRIGTDPLKPATGLALGRASQSFLKSVDWALKLDPKERPKTIQSWREAMDREIPRTEIVGRPKTPHDGRSRIGPWSVATLAAVLAAVGAGVWWPHIGSETMVAGDSAEVFLARSGDEKDATSSQSETGARTVPGSRDADAAQAKFDALARERWKQTNETNTKKAYERFISRFPDSPFAKIARLRAEQLE